MAFPEHSVAIIAEGLIINYINHCYCATISSDKLTIKLKAIVHKQEEHVLLRSCTCTLIVYVIVTFENLHACAYGAGAGCNPTRTCTDTIITEPVLLVMQVKCRYKTPLASNQALPLRLRAQHGNIKREKLKEG